MDILSLLAHLAGADAPAGFESARATRLLERLAPLAPRVYTDALGNVWGEVPSEAPGAPTVLLDAHLDTVGLMVSGHTDGYLRVRALGGVDKRLLLGQEVRVLTEEPLCGVIATLPPHVQKDGDTDHPVSLEDIYVDVGLDAETARTRIPLGTPAVLPAAPARLGAGQVTGQGLDNLVGVAVLLMTLEKFENEKPPVRLLFCASVQEELGHHGLRAAVGATPVDACVVVDVTYGHTPDEKSDRSYPLGGGPCIGVGPNCHRPYVDALKTRARALHLPHQIEVMEGNTGTNAWAAQTARRGIPCAILSVPLKYMHTPVEAACLQDMEDTATLLHSFLREFTL